MPGDRRSFARQPHARARGRFGEDAAIDWLRQRGYRLVARNVTTRAGEIDVIAEDGDTLCFIEVKARASDRYGPAIAAVPPSKQRRLARAAALYLVRKPYDGPCRFDVVGLDQGPEGWRYTLVQDAFSVC